MEQMRSEFEAWIANTTNSDLHRGIMLDRYENGRYRHLATENKWEAWRDSRAAIEIELPVSITQQETCKYGLEPSDAYGLSWGSLETLSQCANAIRAAGLRVKERK